MDRDNNAWVALLRAENSTALGDLRAVLFRNLRRALARLPGVDDAFLEDAAQESLLRIVQRLEQFAGRSQFLTWSTSIAIRVAMGALRRRRWQDVSLDDVVSGADRAVAEALDAQPSVQDEFGRQAMVAAMYQVLHDELSAKQRVALLGEIRGMPQDAIAAQLGTSRNALYKLTHDARKKLRQGLEAAGYSAADLTRHRGTRN